MMDPDWNKGDGLLPAIIQDAADGRVLMLAYMNAESLAATQASGLVTFFSRSRQTLWQKGETSGNILKLVSIDLDCDADTFLIKATPAGPVCHTGSPTCFGDQKPDPLSWFSNLQAIIEVRRGADPANSYTAKLLAGPVTRTAQKVGEEGVEVALAAATGSDEEFIGEGADLIYHLSVLLAQRGLTLSDIASELKARHTAR